MNKLITAISMLFVTTLLDAQDTLSLSLLEAVKYGLANNKTIQSGALDAALNQYKTKVYNTALYPNISGYAGITHYINIPTQYLPANTFDPTAPSGKYTGLTLLLPNITDVGLSANWLLYNQAVYAVQKLIKAENGFSDIQFQKDKNNLALTISQLYYGILFAQKQSENLLKVDLNTKKLIDVLQANYENGMIKNSDVEKVRVNEVSISSQLDQLKSSIETQMNLLKLVTGLPAMTAIKLGESDIENSLTPITDLSSNVENNFDIQLIQNQIGISKLERKTISAEYFPTLGLTYNYSYNWVSTTIRKILSSNLNYPQQYIGINLTVPIFDGNKNLYRLKQNAIATKQLELKSQFLLEQVNTEIINAQIRYNSSLKNVSANNLNVKLGEKLYSENLFEYQQGTLSLNDVLTTENALQQALTVYFNSVSTAVIALLEFKNSTNTLLIK